MDRASRIISVFIVLTVFWGSAVAASPVEPNSIEGVQDNYALTAASAPGDSFWAAWVVDLGGDEEIVASRWDNGQWGPTELVYTNPDRWDSEPSLVVDAQGWAWVAWSSSTGTDDILHLARWTGQGWLPVEAAPTQETIPNRQPVLAATDDGGLWLAWVGSDGNDDEIYAAFWDGSVWSEPQRVSSDDEAPVAYDVQPQLAIGKDGSVWLVWTSYDGFLDDEIYAARWDGQRWSDEQQVSEDDDFANGSPSLAVAENGTVWIAWQGRDSIEVGAGRRIHVTSWSESMGWDEEQMISAAQEAAVSEEQPCLTLDADGLPNVSWRVDDGLSGLGYTTFDGDTWSSPHWAVQSKVAESVCLTGGEEPWLAWWSLDDATTQPRIEQRQTDTLMELPLLDAPGNRIESINVVRNRHLAFGDSITKGEYIEPSTGQPALNYPGQLSDLLNGRVVPSEVINDGVPSERVAKGRYRLLDLSWPMYTPEYMELMEGTNDMTHYRAYNEVAEDLNLMVKWPKKAGTFVLLSTLIPREDSRNDETKEMNGYIAEVAVKRNVPLVDNWQAFYDYGNWSDLLIDHLHPTNKGLEILANTFYAAFLKHTGMVEDVTPPTAWIENLAPQSECGQTLVTWNGQDDVTQDLDFDVQVQVNGGAWTNWMMGTKEKSGTYTGGMHGDTLGFQVRSRDKIGNQSPYSPPKYTSVQDNTPPYDVLMGPLPPVQKAPFDVSWSAKEDCSTVADYEFKYCVGDMSTCSQPEILSGTSTTFDPDPSTLEYGKTYNFLVRARNQANQWSGWSAPASTILARHSLSGQIVNVRHEPVYGATVTVAGALAVERQYSGYHAYLLQEQSYDLDADRDGFGELPPMHTPVVTDSIEGLDMVLPPVDDVVSDGDFEAGAWGKWEASGTLSPTLSSTAHTGDGAVLLGGASEMSQLSQPLSVPDPFSKGTLSFLARLDDETNGGSTLLVELAGTTISHTQVISAETWTHVWFSVDETVGKDVTVTFTLSDTAPIHLDEVRLGSARSGGSMVLLPVVLRSPGP